MRKFFVLFLSLAVLPLLALEEEELKWEDDRFSVQEFNRRLQEALDTENWWAVVDYADIISYHFPTSPFAPDAPYYMGKAYMRLGQLELANQCFSTYLHHTTSPKYFDEAIEFKFQIAEQFKNGVKKPLFGSHKLPKLVPAKEDAILIYDEVITTVPHTDFAVHSLLGKATIQAEIEDYKPSLETLDVLIRRFPKHELAAEAHLKKIQVYLMECQAGNRDPDVLDMAEMALRKFRLAFPRDPKIEEAEKSIVEIKEIFAKNLLEIGRFFEKTKKLPASKIYYQKVISKYPESEAAKVARKRCEQFSN